MVLEIWPPDVGIDIVVAIDVEFLTVEIDADIEIVRHFGFAVGIYDFDLVFTILTLCLWFWPCICDFEIVFMILTLYLWFWHCFYDFDLVLTILT